MLRVSYDTTITERRNPNLPSKPLLDFLTRLKTIPNQKIIMSKRKENQETRSALGITVDDFYQFIRDIKPFEYRSGPEPSVNPKFPGDVWIFKKLFRTATNQNVLLYIKISLDKNNPDAYLIVISFHPNEEYKFKKDDE